MPLTLQEAHDLFIDSKTETWCHSFLDFLKQLITEHNDKTYWYAEVVGDPPEDREIALICLHGPKLSFIVQESMTVLHLSTKWSSWDTNTLLSDNNTGLILDKTTDHDAFEVQSFQEYVWTILGGRKP